MNGFIVVCYRQKGKRLPHNDAVVASALHDNGMFREKGKRASGIR